MILSDLSNSTGMLSVKKTTLIEDKNGLMRFNGDFFPLYVHKCFMVFVEDK